MYFILMYTSGDFISIAALMVSIYGIHSLYNLEKMRVRPYVSVDLHPEKILKIRIQNFGLTAAKKVQITWISDFNFLPADSHATKAPFLFGKDFSLGRDQVLEIFLCTAKEVRKRALMDHPIEFLLKYESHSGLTYSEEVSFTLRDYDYVLLK